MKDVWPIYKDPTANVAIGRVMRMEKGKQKQELKPCPFCGSEKIKIVSIAKNHNTVYCRDCGSSVGEFHRTEKLAVEAWNRRNWNEK